MPPSSITQSTTYTTIRFSTFNIGLLWSILYKVAKFIVYKQNQMFINISLLSCIKPFNHSLLSLEFSSLIWTIKPSMAWACLVSPNSSLYVPHLPPCSSRTGNNGSSLVPRKAKRFSYSRAIILAFPLSGTSFLCSSQGQLLLTLEIST